MVFGILKKDLATTKLGITVDSIDPGKSTLSMPVRPEMINGQNNCHGGYIFILADSACAFASNSRNINMILQSSTINYINSAGIGDRLTAVAKESVLKGRSGIIDVEVKNHEGTLIALFRGLVRVIPGSTIEQ